MVANMQSWFEVTWVVCATVSNCGLSWIATTPLANSLNTSDWFNHYVFTTEFLHTSVHSPAAWLHCGVTVVVLFRDESQGRAFISSLRRQMFYSVLPAPGDVILYAFSVVCVSFSPGQDYSIQEDTSHRFGPTPRRHPVETNTDDVRKLSRTIPLTGHFLCPHGNQLTWNDGNLHFDNNKDMTPREKVQNHGHLFHAALMRQLLFGLM